MNNSFGADQGAADAPELLPPLQQSRHPVDEYPPPSARLTSPPNSPSYIPQPTISRNYRTSGGWNAPSRLEKPEDYYKDLNVGQGHTANYESVYENAFYNSPSGMASTMAPALRPPTSSRMNGNGITSKNAGFSIQRKEYLKPAGSRSASDPVSQKLHPARSSPAIGTSTKSVKEMANRFQQQHSESRNIPSKSIASPPSKLPSAYRQPNAPAPDGSRVASDNHTRVTTRAGQATRDVGVRVVPAARATTRSRFTPEDQESTIPTNRAVAPTRISAIRKPQETSFSKTASKASSSPPKPIPTTEKPLLFGEVSSQSTNGVGYGIPASHTRGSSEPVKDTISLQAAASSDSSSQSSSNLTHYVPTGHKNPHARTSSDTSGKRTNNGVTVRKPLYQSPSSRSSTCSESSRKLGQPASRLPTSKRSSHPSTSTGSPCSTRSNSPFATKASQKGSSKANPRPRSPNARTVTTRAPSRPRYNAPSNSTPHTSPEHAHSPPRSSRARQSVADKTTSASRNRERETSRSRTASQSGSPRKRLSPPKATRQSNIPLEKVDFASMKTGIRQRYSQSIHKQEQTEIRRQQSIRIQNSHRRAIEPNASEIVKGAEEDENPLVSVVEAESVATNPEIVSEEEKSQSESVPLRIDTAPAPGTPVTLSIAEVLGRPSEDSPTLGIPGSFPSAQPSPTFEEIPQSAVSNTTETTDIENDLQDDFQVPGGFDTTTSGPPTGVSSIGAFPNSLHDNYAEESDRAETSIDTENNTTVPSTSLPQSILVPDIEGNGDLPTAPAETVDVPVTSSMDNSGQYLIPDSRENVRYRLIQKSLRDPEDESSHEGHSLYDEHSLYERRSLFEGNDLDEGRSYAPSDSFPRTPQYGDQGSRQHSVAWTDYSVTSASDMEVGHAQEEKPPTPPPKTMSMKTSANSSFVDFNPPEIRPVTPFSSLPSRHASPLRPLSLAGPEVPPKPASYSPMPSPRIALPSPQPSGGDAPVSPRSFGTAAVVSSHRRTSSSTPLYTPGTGWTGQPPVPNSRPTSMALDNPSNGSSISIQTSPSNELDHASSSVESPVVVETGEQQKERKLLRDRRNIIREIVDSEAKHVRDMYVIKEIWQGTADACPKLTEADKVILFNNINEIAALGAKFLEKLKRANSGVYEGRKAAANGSKVSNEDSLITANNNDRSTSVGGVFVQFIHEIESVNWPFIIKFQEAQIHLETLLQDGAISIWDQECRRAMLDISECWDLKSLIIKPFQRIIKYKDLLERLATKTSAEHPDYANLQKAISEVKDFLLRLNQAMPPPEPVRATPKIKGKQKDTDTRSGFMKNLARKTLNKSPALSSGMDVTADDDNYIRLRNRFSDEYVRLQVVLRDVEYYTREVNEFMKKFVHFAAAMEFFTKEEPKRQSAYPELESKWRMFHISMLDMQKKALADHIAAVRMQFISPFEQLIALYQNPNTRMAERAKRRMDWEKVTAKKGNLFNKDSLRSKAEKSAERYVHLNTQLKRELPLLSIKTNRMAHMCIENLIRLQTSLYSTWKQQLRKVFEHQPEDKQIPADMKSILTDFHREFTFLDATVKELAITNPTFLKGLGMPRNSTSDLFNPFLDKTPDTKIEKGRDSKEQRSRPPSSNGKPRPPPLSRVRAGSSNTSLLPTPDFGRHNDGGFITPSDPNAGLQHNLAHLGHGLGITESSSRPHDNISISETLVNSHPPSMRSGRPSTSRTSTSRTRPPVGGFDGAYDELPRKHSDVSDSAAPKARDSGSGYYWRRESDPSERSIDYYDKSRPVSGSTTFSSRIDGPFNGRPPSGLDGLGGPNLPYSGVFQSAMPLSDGPDAYNARISRASSFSSIDRTDDRGRGDGYNVLYLAASLFEFHISDTKREGIYPYLTYEAGELFDVIGEKGELWLAKNQDDPPDKIKVGWIWSKHFARLAE